MFKNLAIVTVSALVVALPFIFRREETLGGWSPGDPVLVVISPHNEAIRYEFGRAFSKWHEARYGAPVKVDWRTIGGTTEIMRYLGGEYTAAFRAWWTGQHRTWPEGGGDMILDRRFRADRPPAGLDDDPQARQRWELKRDLHGAFREIDDPKAFGCRIDLFFGGGTYDHGKAAAQGLTVAPWAAGPPTNSVAAAAFEVIPEALSGETWRTSHFFGTAVSTFGICYNTDRLADLELRSPPSTWNDLTAPAYFQQLGVADPTKSGSTAKAFEMMIHEQCARAVAAAGFTPAQASAFEQAITDARLPAGEVPDGVPPAYQAAVEAGWMQGLRLVQRIGANARYFTDGAGKVPIDVSMGNAAAGVAIDFYGRYQAERSRLPDGRATMVYTTPAGGSSVSADPISLLRGARHRELAVRFISFVLGEDGQRLWNYRPGAAGGPERFALRRLPIRRDFYPLEDGAVSASAAGHQAHCVDALDDPRVNPYVLATRFNYHARWTARHFSIHRDLIRVMCMDAGEELQDAWRSILASGGPERQVAAMRQLEQLPDWPEPLNWRSALTVRKAHSRLDYMREWTLFFRHSYRKAKALAEDSATIPEVSG